MLGFCSELCTFFIRGPLWRFHGSRDKCVSADPTADPALGDSTKSRNVHWPYWPRFVGKWSCLTWMWQIVYETYRFPSKIEWDLTNGPCSVNCDRAIRYSGAQGSVKRGSDRWRFLRRLWHWRRLDLMICEELQRVAQSLHQLQAAQSQVESNQKGDCLDVWDTPLKTNMTGWKITIFNRKYIFH